MFKSGSISSWSLPIHSEKGTDVIKKARAEAKLLEIGPAGESLRALHSAEFEDMCEGEDGWQWQGDHYWKEEESEWKTWTGPQSAVCDSTTGQPLDMRKVKAGCNEELGWMRKMHVWDRVPRGEAAKGGAQDCRDQMGLR